MRSSVLIGGMILLLCLLLLGKWVRHESFENYSVMLTRSYFDEHRLTLAADRTDVNDELMATLLTSLFPLLSVPIDYQHLQPQHLVLLPQMYNNRVIPFHDQFVASLYPICLTLILPINSTVSTYTDMETVVIGTLPNASVDFLTSFASIMNLRISTVVCTTYKELYSKWKKNEIGAIFLLVSHPNQFVKLLSYQEEIKFFNWNQVFDNVNLRRILNFHFQDIKKISISIQTYRLFKLSQYYTTYGFYVNLVAPESIPSEYIYRLLQTVYQNISKIKVNFEFAHSLSPEWMSYCPPNMNYHSGAKSFYTDINVISDYSPKCYMLNMACNDSTIDSIDGIISRRIGII